MSCCSPASPDGRDVAGIVSALTGPACWSTPRRSAGRATVRSSTQSAFGGKLITESAFTDGPWHHHRPPELRDRRAAPAPGSRRGRRGRAPQALPAAGRRPGRGGGAPRLDRRRADHRAGWPRCRRPGGLRAPRRPRRRAGWSGRRDARRGRLGLDPVRQQIGQTGKIVKPPLYLALGHQRRDPAQGRHADGGRRSSRSTAIPDAPIADFADLFVVGDLFEVGPALLAELRARQG